ncbi:hypothetical protein KDA11_01035 [Candidatus Saccharibacteria bacterium]|nr:hypothetical protein [Candidatus Saccharibacteria bacterium]
MIQFNLLPDVKQEYIKAKRQKHSVIMVSLLVASVSLFIFMMLFLTVRVFQVSKINNLNDNISSMSKTLKETTDLNKILTIQNQLNNLPELHDNKPVVSRLTSYVSDITPSKINIGDLEVDFEANTIQIKGTAESLQDVNKFVDTMKFTTIKDGDEDVKDTPFSNVVLSDFTRNEDETTYTIDLSFDPIIFDVNHDIALSVPKITSTRSETEKPTELFKALPQVNTQ